MLRTPQSLNQGDVSSPMLRSIEDESPASFQIRWGSISSTQPVLSRPEQGRVYQEWIGAGRPHNIFPLPPSASGSPRGTNPGVQSPQKQDSPFGSTSIRAEGSPGTPRPSSSFSRMAPSGSNRIDDCDSGLAPDKLPPVAEMYPQVLEYLNHPGAQTDQFGQLPQFRNQLGLMMKEIDSYRSLLQDQANLKEDHLRLQTENTKIRAYLNSSLAPREPAIASPSAFSHSSPRPPTETRGKSWDSIALDLI
ncbi:hypothetical protein PENANT_c044G11018 [Penicillium antarcticum]|uniref:Uncharacterized protein n=1 Tax=Penicillium antarcticum TaxID=416450 RepID=A0A1V6PS58_9EURO|nr:hypothetical protein PENANT_c044G11018 [Penicillium antarcticum]